MASTPVRPATQEEIDHVVSAIKKHYRTNDLRHIDIEFDQKVLTEVLWYSSGHPGLMFIQLASTDGWYYNFYSGKFNGREFGPDRWPTSHRKE